jgi:signal transduction histidine kinase/ligand-binding sensor domain-containing protein/AraC-like DNA-binding protein
MKKLCILLLCWTGTFFLSQAEEGFNYQNIRFKQIRPEKNGINNGYINAIYEDKRGFLWIATPTGLFRYNGYDFKSYYPRTNDSTSLSGSNILCIAEDNDSNLWLGTDNGLNLFIYKKNKFVQFVSAKNPFVITDYIASLCVTGDILWVGTSFGLSQYNLKTQATKIFTNRDLPAAAANTFIARIIADRYNNIYFLTSSCYFIKYHASLNQFIPIAQMSYDIPFSKQEDLYNFNDSIIYVAYGQNVFEYDIKTNKLQRLIIDGQPLLAPITGITTDRYGKLWMVSTYKDVYIIDPKTHKTLHHTIPEGNEEGSDEPTGYKCIFADRNRILWLGSYDNGISYTHPSMSRFQSYMAGEKKNNGLNSNFVNAILQTSRNEILVGTENGLQRWLPDRQHFENIPQIGKDPVLCIFEDSKNNLWVTTYKGKIYCKKNGQPQFASESRLSSSINRAVRTIAEDKQGNLWLGTLGSGVFRFNGSRVNDFKTVTGYELSDNYINKIICDKQNNLWITTSSGICRYQNGRYKIYLYVVKDKLLNVKSVFQDRQGRIWFGYPSGLLYYLPDKDSIALINHPVLQKSYILGIIQDRDNSLWLTTNFGLIHASIDSNMKCNACQVYYTNDGLPDNVYRSNAIELLYNGEIMAGSNRGIARILPESKNTTPYQAKLYFTGLKVFNKDIHTGEMVGNRILLPQSLTDLNHMTITYRQNMFSIEFAALYFINPMSVSYKYKLEGFDTSWITTDATYRYATYTNLPAGKYTLHVVATLPNNQQITRSLSINILPPFWKSTLAKILYLLILAGSLYLLRIVIRHNEKKKMQIQKEREEAQRMHQMDMLKINFFTNISHELRTPLSLILAPLEKIMSINHDPKLDPHLNIIKRNANRLLQLVNQLLDFRKLDSYGLEYNPSMNDVVSFTRDIAMSFTDMAEIKGIRYIFNTNVKELVMEFDAEKYEKILFNLLSNAFKYTPEKGTIAVELNFYEEINIRENNPVLSGELVLKVKDNGIGIPEHMKEKIFDQFVQAKTSIHPLEHGTGIGLALVKEYVRLHQGTIELDSSEGQGSCFTVKIPVQKTSVKISDESSVNEILTEKELVDEPEINVNEKTILLVEDNEELRFYLKDNFKHKYRILEANNGQKGLTLATQAIPDIVITDIMLPIMDGITLCKKLKNSPETSHIPVIMLTALNTSDSQISGIEAGADDYIVKPFNFKVLEAKIKQLTARQKQKQQEFSNKINIEPKEITITSLDEKFIKKALEIVEKNIGNADFSVEAFSAEMGMSRMLLYKKLMTLTGKSPVEFIRTMRLKRAAQLLVKSQLNVSEIAFQVGFNDAKYFSQCFKKEFNMLPSEYKEANEQKQSFNLQ